MSNPQSSQTSTVDEDYWNQSDFKGMSFEEVEEPLESWDTVRDAVNFDSLGKSPIIPSTTALDASSSLDMHLLNTSLMIQKMGKVTWEPKLSRPYADERPYEMTHKIILGQHFTLEHFKSLEDKLGFLDSAIKSMDGNAIVMALIFLKKTLKISLFNQIIIQRPIASRHYEIYLKNLSNFAELMDFYSMVGKPLEAAMLSYSMALNSSDHEDKIKKISDCVRNHFRTGGMDFYSGLLAQYITLLRIQLPIELEDNKSIDENRCSTQFKSYPKSASLLNTSVLSTLYYCCLYHYYLSESNFASPLSIKKQYQLTDKQFVWISMAALTKQKMWTEIESLFTSKNWLGSTKMKCCIGYDRALDLLYHNQAPIEIMSKYLRRVDDKTYRLEMARKYQCHAVTIETLAIIKDRLGMLELLAKLHPTSSEYVLGQEYLQQGAIKWRN